MRALVRCSFFRYLCFVLSICGITGCGNSEPVALIRGKVIYKKEPVDRGRVVLFPKEGVVASGTLTPDGTFTVLNREKSEEIKPGEYKVVVVAGLEQINLQGGTQPRVPLKFTSMATTPLTFEFQEGPNNVEINLDGPGSIVAK